MNIALEELKEIRDCLKGLSREKHKLVGDHPMKAWYEGRADGFKLAAKFLDDVVKRVKSSKEK